MQKAKFDKFYLVKIELTGIKPPIWRRIVVPKNLNLSHFDTLVWLIMGWSGYRLSAFEVGDKWYKKRLPDEVDFWDKNMDIDCAKYVLSDILNKKRPKINHYYDFGDDWKHKITLENDDFSNYQKMQNRKSYA